MITRVGESDELHTPKRVLATLSFANEPVAFGGWL
jgi:hypothetical protein